jgi:methylenetetrahydrofolate--tRNA-(uracil-5-)-methyltransferase
MENIMADSYNLVGFQNHMKYPEQNRVFRMIPGFANAEFLRFGQIHRNSYINAPRLLYPTLQTRKSHELLFAGQLCGIEGYVESIATGLIAGINAGRLARGEAPLSPPRYTACGSLLYYISSAETEDFQPANISFGLLGTPAELTRSRGDRKERHRLQVQEALRCMDGWIKSLNI